MPAKPPQTLRVFIGCPGDMGPERDALLSLEKKLAKRGCPVEFLIWPDVPPAPGRPQQVIFDHFPVATWDIFIGLLWNRFGSPSGETDDRTGKPMTGTEEEFKAAYRAWKASGERRPHIAVYRCERAANTKGKGAQIAQVDAFFEELSADGGYAALAHSFTDTQQLKDAVEEHLVDIAAKIHATAKKPAISPSKAASVAKKAVDWAAAEASYRQHLIDSHRIVKFHTAEARAPVEVELEKVFIKLLAVPHPVSSVAEQMLQNFRDADYEVMTLTPEEAREARVRLEVNLSGKTVRAVPGWEMRVPNNPAFIRLLEANVGKSFSFAQPTPTTLPDLLRQQNHLALAGSPGSGKSTLLQYLVLTFASQQQQARLQLDEPRLPVLIRLRQFYRWIEQQRHEKKFHELNHLHFQEFAADAWQQDPGAPKLRPGFFRRLFCQPNALILLDGLDEVADPAQRRDIAALVATSLDHWREARVILTSRPKAWESEGRSALGSRVGEARICDLDDTQIADFVRHWYLAAKIATHGDTAAARADAESRAVDLIAAVKPERIRKLAATPLMLSILAMVHSRGVGLPQERSQLYHECIEFMLGYWDEVQGLSHDSELTEVAALARATKRQLLEPVALWMHRLGSEQIEPLHDDLVREFARGFESVLNEQPACAKRHARAFLRLIVERGGLMQESEAGQFRFVHLTFQEYLAASAIAHGESPFAQVQPHLHDPWWREVILLAGGELSRQRSYRVKTDTTAWLSGILNNNTWAEQYLLRDLQLAAQSCADMAETGVAPEVTTDLATRLIAGVLDKEEGKPVARLDEFIRQLPPGHLTRAIAEQLPGTQPRGKTWRHQPALVLAPLLPAAVIHPPLLATFAQSIGTTDHTIASRAAFLSVLYSQGAKRLVTIHAFTSLFSAAPLVFGPKEIERLFALGDKAVSEAIFESARKAMCSPFRYSSAEMAAFLVRHGTAEEKKAGLAWLMARIDGDDDHVALGAMMLGSLGALADSPEVVARLEAAIQQRRSERAMGRLIRAWESIVSSRGGAVDIALLLSIATDFGNSGWQYAVPIALKHGDAETRAAIRKDIVARMAESDSVMVLFLAKLLLENDAEADRASLATRVEQVVAGEDEMPVGYLLSIAGQLTERAWQCPHLFARLSALVSKKHYSAPLSLAILAELARVRSAEATTNCPPVAELAQQALDLTTEVNASERYVDLLAPFRALSTFPELRTAVAAKIQPVRKRKTEDRKKKVRKE